MLKKLESVPPFQIKIVSCKQNCLFFWNHFDKTKLIPTKKMQPCCFIRLKKKGVNLKIKDSNLFKSNKSICECSAIKLE